MDPTHNQQPGPDSSTFGFDAFLRNARGHRVPRQRRRRARPEPPGAAPPSTPQNQNQKTKLASPTRSYLALTDSSRPEQPSKLSRRHPHRRRRLQTPTKASTVLGRYRTSGLICVLSRCMVSRDSAGMWALLQDGVAVRVPVLAADHSPGVLCDLIYTCMYIHTHTHMYI